MEVAYFDGNNLCVHGEFVYGSKDDAVLSAQKRLSENSDWERALIFSGGPVGTETVVRKASEWQKRNG